MSILSLTRNATILYVLLASLLHLMTDDNSPSLAPTPVDDDAKAVGGHETTPPSDKRPIEIGGVDGPEPTRYGDWERKGRCIDF